MILLPSLAFWIPQNFHKLQEQQLLPYPTWSPEDEGDGQGLPESLRMLSGEVTRYYWICAGVLSLLLLTTTRFLASSSFLIMNVISFDEGLLE